MRDTVMGGVLRFRVFNHHCAVRMPQHDGPGFEEAAKNLIGQSLYLANGAGSLFLFSMMGTAGSALLTCILQDPPAFQHHPHGAVKCLGRRGWLPGCQFSHIPGTQPHSHMPRFREQPLSRPSDPGSPPASFLQTAVQFILLNVLFHRTPSPSQRPPPLPGSYGAKTLIAITFLNIRILLCIRILARGLVPPPQLAL